MRARDAAEAKTAHAMRDEDDSAEEKCEDEAAPQAREERIEAKCKRFFAAVDKAEYMHRRQVCGDPKMALEAVSQPAGANVDPCDFSTWDLAGAVARIQVWKTLSAAAALAGAHDVAVELAANVPIKVFGAFQEDVFDMLPHASIDFIPDAPGADVGRVVITDLANSKEHEKAAAEISGQLRDWTEGDGAQGFVSSGAASVAIRGASFMPDASLWYTPTGNEVDERIVVAVEVLKSQRVSHIAVRRDLFFDAESRVRIFIAIKIFDAQDGARPLLAAMFDRGAREPARATRLVSFGTAAIPDSEHPGIGAVAGGAALEGVGAGGVACNRAGIDAYTLELPRGSLFHYAPGGEAAHGAVAACRLDLWKIQRRAS
jgi:hypothetical protein